MGRIPVTGASSAPTPAAGRLAGIDFGTVRIGIAITDAKQTFASPYENYRRRGDLADAERFRRLIREEGVVAFVVGLPVHLDGRESEKSAEARKFGAWLEEVTAVRVIFFDERFSTSEASAELIAAGLSRKRRRGRLDMLAAQMLLSAFLDSRTRGQQEPGPLGD